MITNKTILLLKGLKLADLEEIQEKPTTTHNHIAARGCSDRLPEYFTKLEGWPNHTSLKCWECAENFFSRPLFIPVDLINDKDEGIMYKVHGNFCSWGCLSRYVKNGGELPINKYDCLNMIHEIYRVFTGKKICSIPAAISKTLMKKYCGPNGLTEEEFRDRIVESESIHWDQKKYH